MLALQLLLHFSCLLKHWWVSAFVLLLLLHGVNFDSFGLLLKCLKPMVVFAVVV